MTDRNSDPPKEEPNKRGPKRDPVNKMLRHMQVNMREEIDQLATDDAPSFYRMAKSLAMAGDVKCVLFFMDRLWPKRAGSVISIHVPELRGASSIGSAMDAVLAQVADGRITTEEGKAVMDMLLCRVKAFEAAEIMVEVRAVQEQVQTQAREAERIRAEAARALEEAREARSRASVAERTADGAAAAVGSEAGPLIKRYMQRNGDWKGNA